MLDFVLTDKGKQLTRSYLLPSINWTLLKLLPIKQISYRYVGTVTLCYVILALRYGSNHKALRGLKPTNNRKIISLFRVSRFFFIPQLIN